MVRLLLLEQLGLGIHCFPWYFSPSKYKFYDIKILYFADNGNPVIVRDVSFRGSQDSDEGLGSDPRTPVSFTGLLNRSGSATPSRRTWDYENIPR